MTFDERIALAVTLAAGEVHKNGEYFSVEEYGSLIEACYRGIENAEHRLRGQPGFAV